MDEEKDELVQKLLDMIAKEKESTICVVKTDRESIKDLIESNNELMINYDSLIKESNDKNVSLRNIIIGLIFALVLVCGMICFKDYMMWNTYLKTPSDVSINAKQKFMLQAELMQA